MVQRGTEEKQLMFVERGKAVCRWYQQSADLGVSPFPLYSLTANVLYSLILLHHLQIEVKYPFPQFWGHGQD